MNKENRFAGPDEKKIPTFCAMCGPSAGCGIYAYLHNGRFARIEGMKESPLNRGKNCPKAHAAPQWVYSSQRLRHPLIRAGGRGEGKFRKVTWDEALDFVARKLAEQKEAHGPESLAILSPARRSYSEYLYRFLMVHGSPNYGHSGICAMQNAFSFAYTLGEPRPVADYEKSDLIVIWGKQPVFSGSSKGSAMALVGAKARGAKIVAIKPSMEPDAALSDIWVPIRPGTDAALALAMLQVVIGEGLYDFDFVSRWCDGFGELEEHVQNYTPEWAAPITGLDPEQIRRVSRLYATTKRAAIDPGNGLEHAPSASDAVRAIAILIAITGHFDRPGGNIVPEGSTMPRPKSVHLKERYTREWVEKLVAPEFPRPFQPFLEGTSSAYYRIFESVLTEQPYPIRTVIAPGTQPTVSTRGSKRVVEALKKVDFFVVIDVTRTAEMNYADVVIPVATPYEADHPFEATENWIMARNKVIEPLGDYKSMYEFWLDLGVRMGYGKDFWDGSMEDCLNYQLEPLGMTIDELRSHPAGIVFPMKSMEYEKYGKIFSTRSSTLSRDPYLANGKVAIYNRVFEKYGYDPLPGWREPPESVSGTPELLERYPLVFSDFHTSKAYTASWLRNVPYLRELLPFPTVQIHPEAASKRGINDGDWIIVESPHGSMKVKAEINPGIRPDTVMALHGWWQGCRELGLSGYPVLEGGANTNNMYCVDTETAFDPLVTAMSSQTLVEVRRADD
ncbi:MAG: molybdopterin-dependent oxidoreductase [Deltaproteobacteria bacterium]|nr:molybdopterin-dependent oxidoreductase [Deltaproteobacteria bacterium]MBW2137078.1 molybdopterin-dependent oxidoreductase [Deltaproteobacteria bacterium]